MPANPGYKLLQATGLFEPGYPSVKYMPVMLPAVWLIRLTLSLASIVPVISIWLLTAVSLTTIILTETGPFFLLPLPAVAALVCLSLFTKKLIIN
jgi:hypothetical protein